ncbi:unnamed protein product [Phytophthora lilii]|uniref:Unnamed protein product n=1 Tax=Phytophthora lilii TaxID=2077276 RepID=A0A9W6X5W3_9STRA|nr:unnamed protein product [Phytophthora lilii]
MPKRVMRLAIEFEDFRGEDEFILLDLDDRFDLILGMPWLKRYQPRIDSFNKLNDVTIPAQTPVPRKDMILDGMVGSTVFSAIDLKDGFYQIRMREDDVPLTAVSTPSQVPCLLAW